jgi:hypothetical protein
MRSTRLQLLALALLGSPGIAWADSGSAPWLAVRPHDAWRVCWIAPCTPQSNGGAPRLEMPATDGAARQGDPAALKRLRPLAIVSLALWFLTTLAGTALPNIS